MSRAWRFVGSLRLGIILLALLAVASVVGIWLPQPESFKSQSYFDARLDGRSDGAMTAAEFAGLARSAGVTVGGESFGAFAARARKPALSEEEQRLLPHAVMSPSEARKAPADDLHKAYADLVARAKRGEFADAELERLFFTLFLHQVSGEAGQRECLKLSYVDTYGSVLGRALLGLRLHSVFRSWWFRLLCGLLVVNLMLCSARRFPALWRTVFGPPAGTEPGWYQKRSVHATVAIDRPIEEAADALDGSLRARGFRVCARLDAGKAIVEGTRGWLGALGRVWAPLGNLAGLGRFGALVVHLGVVLIVVGGFISGILRFTHFQWAAPDEVVAVPDVSHRHAIVYQIRRLWGGNADSADAGTRAADAAANALDWRETPDATPPKVAFRLRVDSFEVKRDVRGKPETYRAGVTVLETDPPLKQDIEVNCPLIYAGFYVYQDSLRDDPARLKSASFRVTKASASGKADDITVAVEPNTDMPVPGTDLVLRIERFYPAGRGLRVPVVRLRASAPGAEPASQMTPLPLPDHPGMASGITYGDYQITATGFQPASITGLRFRTHPVMWPVWVGCGVMMAGIVLSFYCNHERVWALVRARDDGGSEIWLAGNAFKWRESFQQRFDGLVAALGEREELGGAQIRSDS